MATETWYPAAVRLPIRTQEYFKQRAVSTVSIVDHITAGLDSRGWLQNADNGSSVHFLIRVEGGAAVVYQFMPIEWAAWGNGRYSNNNPYMPAWVRDMIARQININHATISIEHEGVAPTSEMYTGVMLDATIALHKWLASVVPTIKVDREHIIGHYQIDHIDRANCPGGPGGRLYPFQTILDALRPDQNAPLLLPGASHAVVVKQFKEFYLSEPKALQYWGLPIEDTKQTVLSDGNTYIVQYFERARFELHGSNVLLGLVGAELLAKE